MTYNGTTVNFELNRLAGTSGLDDAGAANVWAGTSGLDLVGALNEIGGVNGVDLGGVCNIIAGTSGLQPVVALSALNPGGVPGGGTYPDSYPADY